MKKRYKNREKHFSWKRFSKSLKEPIPSEMPTITLQDIKDWRAELDAANIKARWNDPNPIIEVIGDRVYFRGPQIYGSCDRKKWNDLLLQQGLKTK